MATQIVAEISDPLEEGLRSRFHHRLVDSSSAFTRRSNERSLLDVIPAARPSAERRVGIADQRLDGVGQGWHVAAGHA